MIVKGENCTYIMLNGVPHKIESPATGYGKQTVIWQNGKPVRYEVNSSENLIK